MASLIYNKGKAEIMKGNIDLVNDTIKVMLVSSSYTPDKDNDEDRADVTNEVSGTGYSGGGKALSGGIVTQDDSNDQAAFDADDLTWTIATLSGVRGAVIYQDNGAAASDTLIAYIDLGDDYGSSSEDFTIEWDADGILTLGE